MNQLYEAFDVDEETPVHYVGVYTTHWRSEWGQPEVMFREADLERHDAEVRQAERERCAVIAGGHAETFDRLAGALLEGYVLAAQDIAAAIREE